MNSSIHTIALSLLLLTGVAKGQSMADLERIQNAAMTARACAELVSLGGADPACPESKPKRDVEARPRPPAKPEVLSYVALPSAAGLQQEVDVLLDGEVHRLRVGDSVGPWTLRSLSDFEAVFARGRQQTRIGFRGVGAVREQLTHPLQSFAPMPGNP